MNINSDKTVKNVLLCESKIILNDRGSERTKTKHGGHLTIEFLHNITSQTNKRYFSTNKLDYFLNK